MHVGPLQKKKGRNSRRTEGDLAEIIQRLSADYRWAFLGKKGRRQGAKCLCKHQKAEFWKKGFGT